MKFRNQSILWGSLDRAAGWFADVFLGGKAIFLGKNSKVIGLNKKAICIFFNRQP